MMHGLGCGWIAGPPWSLMDAASHSPHAASSHWLWSAADLGTSSISPQRWAMRCWRPASGLSVWWQAWCRPQRQKSSHRVHSTSAALCQISRHCSVGAAALSKPRRDMSDFRWEEQLVIKNNNLEVLELYFPWLPHAQNLNPTDKSCTFGLQHTNAVLLQSRLESTAWVCRWHKGSPWHLTQYCSFLLAWNSPL